jgi:hypothetical protein
MMYCYHCTTRLSKEYEVCPHCNKTLDMDLLKTLYDTNSSRSIKKSAVLKIWFKENSRIISPVITFAAGILIGIAVWWSYAQIQISQETAVYRAETVSLQARIAELEGNSKQNLAGLQTEVAQRDSIIARLKNQKQTLAQLISFTRRLSRNAQITPESQDESDFYRRNTLYLINEFDKQQQALAALDDNFADEYNLQTIPQLLSAETADLNPSQF